MAADKDHGTPRVFLTRHGQTEWSITGRWTGRTDLPLTAAGENQVLSSARQLVGPGKLIDPASLALIFVSPMKRATRTYELMFEPATRHKQVGEGKVRATSQLLEWDYGAYEGLMTSEIRKSREERSLDGKGWDHFKDGCEDGESPEHFTERIDALIKEIREVHRPNMHGEKACNILLVAHGHTLRGFVRRWLGYPVDFPLSAMLEPGGIGILSYQHHNIDEPAFLLGMALPEDHQSDTPA